MVRVFYSSTDQFLGDVVRGGSCCPRAASGFACQLPGYVVACLKLYMQDLKDYKPVLVSSCTCSLPVAVS